MGINKNGGIKVKLKQIHNYEKENKNKEKMGIKLHPTHSFHI